MNETEDTQNVQLGEYQDAAPLGSSAANNETRQDPYKIANMEVFTLDRVIEREYKLASLTWTTSQTTGTSLGAYDFPTVLFSIPFIQQKINDFRFFRSAIRMTFRLASNRFLYGKVMVVFQPTIPLTPFLPTSVNRFSSYPHVLISASAGEAVVFDMPYISQKRGLDLEDYVYNEMANVNVVVLNPLTDVMGEPSSAQILVTAQFIDAELWLPHDQGTIPTSVLGNLLRPKQIVVETQSGHIRPRRSKEGHVKSTTGSVSETLESASTLTSFVNRVASKTVSENLYDMGRAAATAVLMMGLSKPTTTDTTSVVRINPYSDVPNGKGIDTCPKLAMDPENQISTVPNVGGINEDEMELSYIASIPVLCSVPIGFTSATPATQIATTSPFDNQLTLVDFLSRNFLYRSGSLKFKIYITASQFHAIRMVFYLSDAGDTVNSDWQQCYHRVVDIQGDTEVEIMTPYCSNQMIQGQTDNTEFGLWAQVLSWSQPDNTVSAPIYLNIYKAGDSDMQFAVLIENKYVVTSSQGNLLRKVSVESNPRADFRKPFQPIQDSITAYDHGGFVIGERYTTVREIVHRYQAYNSLTTGGPAIAYLANGLTTAPKTYIGLEMWGLLYNYWRGSVRIKLLQSIYTKTGAAYYSMPGSVQLVGTVLSSPTNPVIDAELPYYRPVLFSPTMSNTVNDGYVLQSSGEVNRFLMKAAGDDFSFHFLHLPPTGTLSYIGASGGNAVLNSYLAV